MYLFRKNAGGMYFVRPWLRWRLGGLLRIVDGIGMFIGWPWNFEFDFYAWEMKKGMALRERDSSRPGSTT